MNAARDERDGEVPEADFLEQQTPLDPDADTEVGALAVDQAASEVNDADRLEQLAVVPDGGEDDRPRHTSLLDGD